MFALALGLLNCSLSGCGYMVGAPYRKDIHTVYVPTFTSDSTRRGIEYQLTEAVQKEIAKRTPYRLAKRESADTKLTGHVVQLNKTMLSESAFDEARELQFALAVQISWQDTRTGRSIREESITLPPELSHLYTTSDFAPEIGQSRATAIQSAIDEMARQIVEKMEYPW